MAVIGWKKGMKIQKAREFCSCCFLQNSSGMNCIQSWWGLLQEIMQEVLPAEVLQNSWVWVQICTQANLKSKSPYWSVDAMIPKERMGKNHTGIVEKRSKFFDEAAIGYWEWHVKTGKVVCNRHWADIIGYSLEEVSSLTIEGLKGIVHPDDAGMFEIQLAQVCSREADNLNVKYRLKKKSGGWAWVHDRGSATSWVPDGKPLSILLLALDISESMQLEEHLRKSEEQFRLVSENTSDGIIIFSAEGRIIFLTDAYIHQLGYDRMDELSRDPDSIYLLIHPDDRERVYAEIYGAIGKKMDNVTYTYRCRHHEGHYIWREDHAALRYDNAGDYRGAYVVCRDITDRKQAQDALVTAQRNAEAATIAKSRFLANMSHEIRTPINGLFGMLQLLELTQLSEEQEEFIRDAKVSTSALLSIVNDILDYSKIEADRMTLRKAAFAPAGLILEVMKMFSHSAEERGLSINAVVSADVPETLIGDSFRLRQILVNIIGNAIKFTNEGGVEVTVENACETNGGKAKLKFKVRDTGKGIPLEKTADVFERFTQVEDLYVRESGGVGLGLAISKSLVEMMEGEIWADSVVGKGSSFYFTCVFETMRYTDGHIHPMMESRENRLEIEKPLSVLWVSDNSADYGLAELLYADPYKWVVTHAQNGEEAVEFFDDSAYDIIFLNYLLPVVDGYTVTRIMRHLEESKRRHTPIIAMITTASMQSEREKCLKAGMDDCIATPLCSADFFRVVEKWTGKAFGP